MKQPALILFVCTCALALASTPISVDQLIKDRASFDKKVVSVTGTVSKYQERTSKAGNKYTVFTLKGSKASANVYLQQVPAVKIKDGSKVTVTGSFEKLKDLKSFKVENEIDCTANGHKGFGIKING